MGVLDPEEVTSELEVRGLPHCEQKGVDCGFTELHDGHFCGKMPPRTMGGFYRWLRRKKNGWDGCDEQQE